MNETPLDTDALTEPTPCRIRFRGEFIGDVSRLSPGRVLFNCAPGTERELSIIGPADALEIELLPPAQPADA